MTKPASRYLPLLLGLVTSFGGVACRSQAPRPEDEASTAQPMIPTPPTWASSRVPPPESTQPLREGEVPFDATDPAHVDPADLLAQARAIALRSNAHSVLTEISVHPAMSGGTVDLSAGTASYILYTFEFLYFDKTRPAGQDKIQGAMWVRASGNRFSVTQLGHAMKLSMHGQEAASAPDPRCNAQKAWLSAVKSGVPETAVASLAYREAWPPGHGGGYVWSFRVDGHNEMNREIDGATCAVVSGAGSTTPTRLGKLAPGIHSQGAR